MHTKIRHSKILIYKNICKPLFEKEFKRAGEHFEVYYFNFKNISISNIFIPVFSNILI